MSAEGWQEEMRSAYLYRIAADSEKGTPREALFRALAGEAESQAAIWASRQGGKVAGGYKPDLRTRMVPTIEALIDKAGVILVGNTYADTTGALSRAMNDQPMVDLTRVQAGIVSHGTYQGICW